MIALRPNSAGTFLGFSDWRMCAVKMVPGLETELYSWPVVTVAVA